MTQSDENDIAVAQNWRENINRLAASRALYSIARVFQTVQFACICVAIVSGIVSFYFVWFAPYAAVISIIVALSDEFFFEEREAHFKEMAAGIQELFDRSVLQLATRGLATDFRYRPELVAKYCQLYERKCGLKTLRDWYRSDVEELPISAARLYCFRACVVWDSDLRDAYSRLLGGSFVVIAVVAALACIVRRVDVSTFILGALLPALPALTFLLRRFIANQKARSRLREFQGYLESKWRDAVRGSYAEDRSRTDMTNFAYEMRRHRSLAPLMPEWLYWRQRPEQEAQMAFSVHTIIDDYQKHS